MNSRHARPRLNSGRPWRRALKASSPPRLPMAASPRLRRGTETARPRPTRRASSHRGTIQLHERRRGNEAETHRGLGLLAIAEALPGSRDLHRRQEIAHWNSCASAPRRTHPRSHRVHCPRPAPPSPSASSATGNPTTGTRARYCRRSWTCSGFAARRDAPPRGRAPSRPHGASATTRASSPRPRGTHRPSAGSLPGLAG